MIEVATGRMVAGERENQILELENLLIMSFSKQDLKDVFKLAQEKDREKEVKVTPSGGSIYLGTDKITDPYYAKKRLEEEKKKK